MRDRDGPISRDAIQIISGRVALLCHQSVVIPVTHDPAVGSVTRESLQPTNQICDGINITDRWAVEIGGENSLFLAREVPVDVYKARHWGSAAQVDSGRLLVDHGQKIFRSANRFDHSVANADRLSH